MRASWRSPYHRPTVAAGDAEVQVANAMAELATLTGISPASADFIGAVEFYASGRFRYFRCDLRTHAASGRSGLAGTFPPGRSPSL
jgi:hypothetical protein